MTDFLLVHSSPPHEHRPGSYLTDDEFDWLYARIAEPPAADLVLEVGGMSEVEQRNAIWLAWAAASRGDG